jgi:hypothetical protein
MATIGNLRGCGRFPEEAVEAIFSSAKEKVRAAWNLGVKLAAGSDAGAYMVPHGQGIADEAAIFRELFGDTKVLRQRLEVGEAEIRERFMRK